MVDWRCDAFVAVVDRRNKNLKATSFDGSFGPPYLLRKPHGPQGRNKHTTTFFTSKVRQPFFFKRRHNLRILYQKTQTQRAVLGFSGAPRQNP